MNSIALLRKIKAASQDSEVGETFLHTVMESFFRRAGLKQEQSLHTQNQQQKKLVQESMGTVYKRTTSVQKTRFDRSVASPSLRKGASFAADKVVLSLACSAKADPDYLIDHRWLSQLSPLLSQLDTAAEMLPGWSHTWLSNAASEYS